MSAVRVAAAAVLVALAAAFAAAGTLAAVRLKPITVIAVKVSEKASKRTIVETDQAYVGGKNVGHDILSCTLISKSDVSCIALIVLGSNTVTARFTTPLSAGVGSGTLDGGTGSFQGRKGTFTWKNLDKNGKRTKLVLT